MKPSIEHEPTSGFNCRHARVSPYWQLDLWDLGGSAAIRQFWGRYITAETQLLIFVVDAADRERFGEARLALEVALKSCGESVALLVLANKQDLPGAATTAETAQALGIDADRLGVVRSAVLPTSCMRAAVAEGEWQQSSGIAAVLAWIATELESTWKHESHAD